MLDRVKCEQREYDILSPLAAKAAETKGREFPEKKCEFRTEYQRDRDRIIHSKAFRRLMHKTQVFLAPEDDHYRTRLTHTVEVSQVSRTCARILMLNEDLTEAIALGHDLGHTPFGHAGETVLNKIHQGGFAHNEQSLRTVDCIEDTSRRRGLNLTYEVRDGIVNHRGSGIPCTLEGQIVNICDRIAYTNHDIDDAIRSGIIRKKDLPQHAIDILGSEHSDRINNLIVDLCRNSEGKDKISLSPEIHDALMELRSFMFANVYNSKQVQAVASMSKVEVIISSLYDYYINHPDELPGIYKKIQEIEGTNIAVKDFIAGMTDRFALNLYDKLFVPHGWR